MSQTFKSKSEIVAEYLRGMHSYRSLGLKHDIPSRTIWDWVAEHKGRNPSWRRQIQRLVKKETEAKKKKPELPQEVKVLHQEIRKLKLHNMLLEETIILGSKHTGIDWKKKFGTKQS